MAGLNAQAEAWAYLRNKGKSKDKYKSRFPSGMTSKKDEGKDGDSDPLGQNDDC